MAKILVVDDDLIIRDLFKRVLAKEGYEVMTAETAEQGLEVIAKEGAENIKLVFLDLRMPGIGGEVTVETLRNCYTSLPIIIISAYGTLPTCIKLIEKGQVDYISKPFDMEYIKVVVRNKVGLT